MRSLVSSSASSTRLRSVMSVEMPHNGARRALPSGRGNFTDR